MIGMKRSWQEAIIFIQKINNKKFYQSSMWPDKTNKREDVMEGRR